MYQKGVLTISEWAKGVQDSPTLGFGSINNCEIFETPGTLKIAPASLNLFASSSPDSLPIGFTEDPNGNQYTITSNGTLYKISGGTLFSLQTGLTNAQDIKFYRDYVWISYGTSVGLYGPTSSGLAQWFPTLVTSLSSSYKKFTICQDDAIYMTNGTNIKYMSGFAPALPAVSPTVTFSTTGWSIPGSYTPSGGALTTTQSISTFIEYNRNLVIGTTLGNVYQWDRADTQLTDVPFKISSGGIKQFATKENRLYITAGNRGNVYVGDGTNFQKLQKIKWRQRRPYTSTVLLNPNAIAISPNGTLLVGTSTETDTFPSTSMHGLHEIQLQGQSSGMSGQFVSYPTCFKHKISTGNTGTSQVLYIGFVAVSNGIIYVGWQDGTTYGFDWIGGTGGGIYTSAYAESPIYPIATDLEAKTFEKLEIRLATPMITGQSIALQYRDNETGTYDTARTYAYADWVGSSVINTSAALLDATQLQAKITLTSPTGVGDTNLEVLSITLW